MGGATEWIYVTGKGMRGPTEGMQRQVKECKEQVNGCKYQVKRCKTNGMDVIIPE
jgi:hypothetical protein